MPSAVTLADTENQAQTGYLCLSPHPPSSPHQPSPNERPRAASARADRSGFYDMLIQTDESLTPCTSHRQPETVTAGTGETRPPKVAHSSENSHSPILLHVTCHLSLERNLAEFFPKQNHPEEPTLQKHSHTLLYTNYIIQEKFSRILPKLNDIQKLELARKPNRKWVRSRISTNTLCRC